MLVHPHQKSLYQFEGNFHAYLHAKKSTPVYFSLETFQINSKFVFSAIWACLVKHNDTKDLKNLSSGKKSISSFGFPSDIARVSQTCYLGYLGNGRLRTPICRKFWNLFVAKKFNFIPYVFEAIAKICELLILGTLGMPGYAHPK